MNGNKYRQGVISQGIKTPIIKQGDDLQEIVISSVVEQAVGGIDDGDIVCITEAVVAISQGNFVTAEDIQKSVMNVFPGAKELVLIDPIQSRNRFMDVLKAIAKTPELEKIYIVMTYPTDEVGNRLVSDMSLKWERVNPYTDIFTVSEFYQKFGTPKHPFTGKNYIAEYLNACEGKGEIILANNFSRIPDYTSCDNFLICSIHRIAETRMDLQIGGAKNVYELSDIMAEPINGSGYNKIYGLYGSNKMSGDKLKLMPRDCQKFVEEIGLKFASRYHKKIEVMVYGDGAFKDPVGGIWELADPETTLATTPGLCGTPQEVKLKYIASEYQDKTPEEIEGIVAREKLKRIASHDISKDTSLGTTPRQITDLIASLADLTTGSGDRQTPVVLIKNYL